MKTIFKTIYGSKLYGTSIPESDTDYKGILVPSAEELLMEEVPSVVTKNTAIEGQKNTSEDIDCQYFSLKTFLKELYEGQTFAVEMLFAPKEYWTEHEWPWIGLVADCNRDKLISKNVSAMVGYAKTQAAKYGEKGTRLEVFQDVVNWLYKVPRAIKLKWALGGLVGHFEPFSVLQEKHKEFITFNKNYNDKSQTTYMNINDVMVPLNCKVEYALAVYEGKLKEYGARATLAMENKGNDLKAIYHAVRIAYQTEELLLTGKITFPRPEFPLLLEIRNGKLSAEEMKALVDESLEKVLEAQKKSTLPEQPNKKWMDTYLYNINAQIVWRHLKGLEF